MKKNRHRSSITGRWVSRSLLFTLLILALAETAFIFFIRNSYYNSARSVIMSRINTISGQLSALSTSDESVRSQTLRNMAQNFSEKEKFELMLLDSSGNVITTSSGFEPEYIDQMNDFSVAQASSDGIGEYIGRDAADEQILSIIYIVPYSAGGIFAVRFVTSLARVDQQITLFILVSVAFAAAFLFFSLQSGVYFIRSIVRPVRKVEQVATQIAGGDFNARIDNVYDDELGRLCDTINNMASELSKTEQMQNEFISSVSHELRTPLTSIKCWVETLEIVNDPKDENYIKGLRIISEETDRLSEMVEELLDFSRMQNSGMVLKMEKLDLGAELSDALLMMEKHAASLHVKFAFREPSVPVAVQADRNRLRQVFVNVLDNALKYSPDGSTVSASVAENGGLATVEIRDEGPGIAPEDLNRVKLKFYKGHGARRGSGIGLAVADEIMKAHGGRLDVESREGKGTLVRISLPLVKISPAAQTNAG